MNNKLVDSHLGSGMPVGDIDHDMFNVFKVNIYGELNKAKISRQRLEESKKMNRRKTKNIYPS